MKKLKQIKEFILILLEIVKGILNGIINTWLLVMWLILFPFIFILDRIFGGWNEVITKMGGWKNETKKEKNNT